MRRLPALLLAGLLLCSLPTYAALGDDMLPTVQRTTSHRYLIRGEYDREETLDTAVISAERVELENKAITGDLTIDSMVGEGPVDLKNVSIGGTLYIYGGGEITLNGGGLPRHGGGADYPGKKRNCIGPGENRPLHH